MLKSSKRSVITTEVFKNTKIKKSSKNAQQVLTWFGQLGLHPQMRENISIILENTEYKIRVSKYYDDKITKP